MQRRVNQADDDRIAIHRFKETIEVLALIGEKFVKRCGATITGFGENHVLYDWQTLGFKEHVLGPAETDADRAVRAGAARPVDNPHWPTLANRASDILWPVLHGHPCVHRSHRPN